MVVYITDSTAGVIKFSTGETLLFIADKLSNLIILDRYLHKSCIIIFYAYKTGVFWRDKLYPVYHTIICIDYDLILTVLHKFQITGISDMLQAGWLISKKWRNIFSHLLRGER